MRPHSLNHAFEWRPVSGPLQFLTDDQAHHYDEQGYVLIEEAFDDETINRVTAAVDPLEQRQEEWLRQQGGTYLIGRADEITFSTHLVLTSEVLRQFARSPVLLGLCADLIGPEVRLYWDQAVYKKPYTTSSFPWYQDNGYAFIDPQQYLTGWIALSDVDEENGCPWVVPGAHRRGTLAHAITPHGLVCLEDPAEAVPVPAASGGIVVFSSLTPRCTGANRTPGVRRAYIAQYAPDGAEVVHVDGDGRETRVPADDPGRQFRVLEQGRPVPA